MQEVLLVSLSLSITVDAVNKLVNPNHIEDAMAMIYLGSAGVFIGLLGMFLFRGYHHDHNIGHEIVEQKKNDFVRSVFTTLRTRDLTLDQSFVEETVVSSPTQPMIVPELVITESGATTNNADQRKKRQFQQDLILPSLNETYKNAFVVADSSEPVKVEPPSNDSNDQQLKVPDRFSVPFARSRSKSGDSIMSSTFALNQNSMDLDEAFQDTRVFATLHALSLHSLVKLIRPLERNFFSLSLQAVLLESSIVLFSGCLNKLVPSQDKSGNPKNLWLKYIDPSLTLVMVVIIAIKAIPVIWSLGQILVEAVPSGINTRQLIQTIMKTIPQIRAVHSVHVWR